jgi:cellulose biosynthesis protein BcsQ
MGKVVMVTSRKGGVAKSSLVWNLAAVTGAAVVDADPQGTLRELASDLKVVASPGPGVIADLKATDAANALTIVDTPPVLDARTLSLMDGSDYFLVPTPPSEMGLQATRLTLQEIARKGRLADALVVFTLVAPRPDQAFVRGVTEAFKTGGVNVANTVLTRRSEVEVAPSFRKSVVAYKPNGKATAEILELWQEMKKLWALSIRHA